MNSLSWFIYVADMLPNLAAITLTLGVSGLTLYVIVYIIRASINVDELPANRLPYPSLGWACLTIGLIVLQALIPSKTTLYSILAVELGEEVLTSEVGQELLTDVREVIQFQLEELKGKKE